jgi:glycyl-tRNA synthetase
MAPTKVLVVPLSNNKDFAPHVTGLCQKLRAVHVACRIDDSSATIGKRYSRNDELGTPLGITVDFQTLKDGTVTLRDRDSMKQVRAEADVVISAVQSIVRGTKSWSDVEIELPAFEGQEINS